MRILRLCWSAFLDKLEVASSLRTTSDRKCSWSLIPERKLEKNVQWMSLGHSFTCCNSWDLNFNCLHWILCTVEGGMINCQEACQTDLSGLSMNVTLDCFYLILRHLFTGEFSFTNASSLLKQFIPLINWIFWWWFLSKCHLKSSSPSNHRLHLMKPKHISALSTWDTIFIIVNVTLWVSFSWWALLL